MCLPILKHFWSHMPEILIPRTFIMIHWQPLYLIESSYVHGTRVTVTHSKSTVKQDPQLDSSTLRISSQVQEIHPKQIPKSTKNPSKCVAVADALTTTDHNNTILVTEIVIGFIFTSHVHSSTTANFIRKCLGLSKSNYFCGTYSL